MTELDLFILVVLIISSLLGLYKGFIREAMSLMSFMLSFFISLSYSYILNGYILNYLNNEIISNIFSHMTIFIITLISLGFINRNLLKFVKNSGLSPADHTIGIVFGFIRGIFIISIIISFGNTTTITNESWWSNSYFVKLIMQFDHNLKNYLPDYFPFEVYYKK